MTTPVPAGGFDGDELEVVTPKGEPDHSPEAPTLVEVGRKMNGPDLFTAPPRGKKMRTPDAAIRARVSVKAARVVKPDTPEHLAAFLEWREQHRPEKDRGVRPIGLSRGLLNGQM